MAQADENNPKLESAVVKSGLTRRLQDIAGVDSVVVDLTDTGGGINVRLESGADEAFVMDKLRALLVAYGVRSPGPPKLRPSRPSVFTSSQPLGVEVSITPLDKGARVEVSTRNVRSFRVVAATPMAIAQGMADAWCQVVGRVPVEIVGVTRDSHGGLIVTAIDGQTQTSGTGGVGSSLEEGLARAVGGALQDVLDTG